MHLVTHWSFLRSIICNKLCQEIIATCVPKKYENVLHSLRTAKKTASQIDTYFRNID